MTGRGQGVDRRGAVRLEVIGGNPATVVGVQRVRAQNWSEGGVGVESRYALPIGAVLTVAIPDADPAEPRVQASVRHVTVMPRGGVRVGLAFVTLNASVLTHLSTGGVPRRQVAGVDEGQAAAAPGHE